MADQHVEGHCFCGSSHDKFWSFSPDINYNIEQNWSNGIKVSYMFYNELLKSSIISLSINSTRIGSSLISHKINQDYFILTIGNEYIPNILIGEAVILFNFRIGYLNTENIDIISRNNNLILSPEVNLNMGRLKLNFGYNLLNTSNVNSNLNPFYIFLNYSVFMNYYCGSSGRRFWD